MKNTCGIRPICHYQQYFFHQLPLLRIYLITVAIMFALKQHYSVASADQLRWILQPVAWIVAGLDGNPYAWEAGTGFVRSDHFITIAPACAGVNFLIMSFGLTVIAFLHLQRTLMRRVLWLAGAFVGAYGLTVVVNATRIILSISLYDADMAWGPLTLERLHCMIGIALYFSALGLYYTILHSIITGNSQSRHLWLPWIWYVTGAVAVPVVHQAYLGQRGPGLKYCLTVIGISTFIVGLGKVCLRVATKERLKEYPCAPES